MRDRNKRVFESSPGESGREIPSRRKERVTGSAAEEEKDGSLPLDEMPYGARESESTSLEPTAERQ